MSKAYGKLEFSYSGALLLPLDAAHKVQMLIAENGILLESIWTSAASINFVADYDVPAVQALRYFPVHDARGLDKEIVREWTSSVRDGLASGSANSVISPQAFAKLSGDKK